MDLIFFTLSMSLLDSLSTTVQIVVFVLLLTTAHPNRNAAGYLAGLSTAYFACGFAGYFVIGGLRRFLDEIFGLQRIPDAVYYQSEFLAGLVLAGLGAAYFFRSKKPKKSRLENWVHRRLDDMSPWMAFGIGAFISLSSFPASTPYLIALAKYAAMGQGLPAVLGLILLYNMGYALPMILVWVAYEFYLEKTEGHHQALHAKANQLNVHLTTWTLVGFGAFSMADAGLYFATGHALIKGRFF